VKSALRYFVFALVLFIVGAGLLAVGRLQQAIVAGGQQMLTLRYDAVPREHARMEQSRIAGALPWLSKMLADIREQRMTSRYWAREYSSLPVEHDVEGAVLDRDPAILLIAADAAFRRVRAESGDRAAVERLNDVLGQYAEVLRRAPMFDAAYNYEFVARTRDQLARAKGPAAPRETPRTSNAALPATIHGRPGGAPERSDTREFKILVPQRTDERNQQPDAGTGKKKPRKG
jgi:hypothetical protein